MGNGQFVESKPPQMWGKLWYKVLERTFSIGGKVWDEKARILRLLAPAPYLGGKILTESLLLGQFLLLHGSVIALWTRPSKCLSHSFRGTWNYGPLFSYLYKCRIRLGNICRHSSILLFFISLTWRKPSLQELCMQKITLLFFFISKNYRNSELKVYNKLGSRK